MNLAKAHAKALAARRTDKVSATSLMGDAFETGNFDYDPRYAMENPFKAGTVEAAEYTRGWEAAKSEQK